MKNKTHKKSGFTLIELLVTITILGILAAIGLGSFSSAQTKARDSRRKSDLANIAKALEIYYNDFGGYPASNTGGQILGCGAAGTTACSWGANFNAGPVNYMAILPTDPRGGTGRTYYYEATGGGFRLYARLENLEDADAVQSGTSAGKYNVANLVCDPGEALEGCNYGIASNNLTLPGVTLDN